MGGAESGGGGVLVGLLGLIHLLPLLRPPLPGPRGTLSIVAPVVGPERTAGALSYMWEGRAEEREEIAALCLEAIFNVQLLARRRIQALWWRLSSARSSTRSSRRMDSSATAWSRSAGGGALPPLSRGDV
jgi:hypothetical protein